MVKEIIFITGNEKKYIVAKKYFENTEIKLIRENANCPEIQNMEVVEVAKFSVKFMAEKLNKPVIKSDNGFYIDALNGFPGTYMRDVQDAIGKEGFKKLMVGEKNRNAKFVDALAYCEPSKEPVIFTGEVKGRLAEEFEGENGTGIDFLFIPEGEKHATAACPKEKLVELYDAKVWQKMIKYLKKYV